MTSWNYHVLLLKKLSCIFKGDPGEGLWSHFQINIAYNDHEMQWDESGKNGSIALTGYDEGLSTEAPIENGKIGKCFECMETCEYIFSFLIPSFFCF
jgi:hypothetical protein